MHQFFVEPSQVGKEFITITGSDVNHIKNVLRMREGEEVRISDGDGKDYLCRINEVTDQFVQADILSLSVDTELPSQIYLYQALPKGDRMETVIEKAVELGAYAVIPVRMKYCVVKLDEKKALSKKKRWQAIALSAAKQSKRSIIPQVMDVMDYKKALSEAFAQMDLVIVPYENEEGMKATKEALKQVKDAKKIAVFIGPEGGFSKEEIDLAKGRAQIISLGRRILRTDTAAISTLSLLMTNLEMNEEESCRHI
ncbi:RsmE family RNA methyltransferase [Eubacterium oxidoreducens]|uniref:Ribosomal RNA small subunit methyltransferase E n=1 Tax=Eubacterium oxidoreducens TaxID=1732 RepID=A0A1G6BGB4_EUBOX|nr:16S rRNA (uracil(1498)-N(3))-methyltransferase [Eubacterium oxidoreducens]SDB19638.1 16S rRNA (uracil1498-N3)-methyltransferase [Eubacterium oxidoreducens]